jgi:hypothetical protein
MATADEQLDNLINNCKKPGDLVGENSLFVQLFRTTHQSASQNGITEHQDKYNGTVVNNIQDKT